MIAIGDMDRGIPTEEVLAEMRASQPPVYYLVGTPKGRLSHLEKDLAQRPWEAVREGVEVKLLPQRGELYVGTSVNPFFHDPTISSHSFSLCRSRCQRRPVAVSNRSYRVSGGAHVLAQSRDRIHKERAMRRRQPKKLWKRLKELQAMRVPRDTLLLKLGAAKQASPAGWWLITTEVSQEGLFSFSLRKDKLREVRRREGRYLLRSNLCDRDPSALWEFYIQLTQVEEAFKNLKGDLALRPIFHQRQERIEAHIFVAFLAYCLHVTLRARLRPLAPGLTPRAVLEKFAAIQMIDVHLSTTDGRTLPAG